MRERIARGNAARLRFVLPAALRVVTVLLVGAMLESLPVCPPAAASETRGQSVMVAPGAEHRSTVRVALPDGTAFAFEAPGQDRRGPDTAKAAGTAQSTAQSTAAFWNPDPRMVALALALAAAALWLVVQGRREAARERRPNQGVLPRRTPQARNLRAQGVLTAMMGLKFGKLLFTGSGMVVSLVTYAMMWGWRYAAGFVMMLFVHELGHVAAARLRGLPVMAIGFVPLMGAYATTERASDPDTEFQVAIGGPVMGTAAAFAALLWGDYSGSGLWFALAYTGFWLNLFNLAPVPILDGGTATAALGPRVWLVGVPVLLAVAAVQFEPLLLLVALLGLPHAYEAWRSSAREPRYWFTNRLSPRNRAAYATILFGLVSLLAVMMNNVHVMAQAALGHG